MFRFRRCIARIAKPLAMVGVVGTLSTALIVTTPTNAQALTARDVKAAETFVMGATKTLAPAANVAMVAASATPVGMVFRVAQLGMLAYSLSDIWWPFVAGTYGSAEGGSPTSPPATGTRVIAGLNYSSVQQVSTNVWQVNGVVPANTSTVWAGNAMVLSCKNRTTGAITKREWHMKHSIPAGSARSTYFQIYCGQSTTGGGTATNEDLVGGVLGSFGAGEPLPASCYAAGNTTPACYWPGPDTTFKWGDSLGTSTPAFDPYGAENKYKVRVECIDAQGVKSTIEAESSGDYMKMPSCAAAGKGHGTGKTSVVGLAPGTTTEKPLWDSPAAPSDPATPLCDASRPTGGCTLSVEIDGKPCTSGDPECENWSEIQKNDPNNTRLKCRFGPYTLPMSQCNLLEQAYRIGGAPATEENTDGNPDTSRYQTPQNTPLANPAPTTTAPAPGASGQTAPGADAATTQCFPAGWAMFNPVEWVLQPIRCAFTPKPETHTQFTARVQNKINTVGFAPVTAAWLAAYEGVGGGSGCSGPTINFSMNGVGQTLQPFQACTEPMKTVAAISNGLSTLVIVFFGGLAIVRAIGAAFGLNVSIGGKSDGD